MEILKESSIKSPMMDLKAGRKRKLGEAIALSELVTNPADCSFALFKENGFDVQANPALLGISFPKPTPEMIAAYKMETLTAARKECLATLQKIHEAGGKLDCCNRFGESLIHVVCRRGSVEILNYLVHTAQVSLFIRDDYGRTPLHDACWTPEPNFPLVEMILKEAPELICVKDVRGHTPLDYVRKEHWPSWCAFLKERKSLLLPRAALQRTVQATFLRISA